MKGRGRRPNIAHGRLQHQVTVVQQGDLFLGVGRIDHAQYPAGDGHDDQQHTQSDDGPMWRVPRPRLSTHAARVHCETVGLLHLPYFGPVHTSLEPTTLPAEALRRAGVARRFERSIAVNHPRRISTYTQQRPNSAVQARPFEWNSGCAMICVW